MIFSGIRFRSWFVPLFFQEGKVGQKDKDGNLDEKGEVDDQGEVFLVGLVVEEDSSDKASDGTVVTGKEQ